MKSSSLSSLKKQLAEAHEECEEEGFEVFSKTARENAREIINSVCAKNLDDIKYYVYPTEEREIVIDAVFIEQGKRVLGKYLMIRCDSKGRMICNYCPGPSLRPAIFYLSDEEEDDEAMQFADPKQFSKEILKIFKEFRTEKKEVKNV